MTAQTDFACPRCGYACDAASGVGPDGEAHVPRPGDISLCLKCGCPMEFGETGVAPRWLVYEELARLDRDTRTKIVQAILHIVTMRPSGVQVVAWKETAQS